MIPWKVQRWLRLDAFEINYSKYAIFNPELKLYLFRKVRKTPVMECNPSSYTTVYSLLSHYDLNMYLIAIKSFLKFYNDVEVVVCGDSSLNENDIKVLKAHIKNIKVVAKNEADEIIIPKLDAYWVEERNRWPLLIKLIDINLLGREGKKILFDSDILFLNRPDEVINWIESDEKSSFFSSSNFSVFDDFEHSRLKIKEKYKIDVPYGFCAGFMGFSKKIVMNDINDALQIALDANININGSLFEQNLYSLILSNGEIKMLPREYYMYNGKSSKDFSDIKLAHFVSYYRFYGNTYTKLASKVIKELHP